MHRVLLLLLFVVGSVFGGVGDVGPHLADAAVAVAHDDCCPDTTPDDGSDCCDEDFGRCCAGGSFTAPVVAVAPAEPRIKASEKRSALPPHLALSRANGPPPTPPPIA